MNGKGRKLNGEFFDPMRGYICAENAQPLPDNIKKMIETVKEAFPTTGRDKIAMVLQSCDYSLEKALSSLSKDGGEDLLGNWSTQGKKGKNGVITSKSKRKRRNKKSNLNNKDEINGETRATDMGEDKESLPDRLSDCLDGLEEVASQLSEKDLILPNSDSGVVVGSECSSRKSSFSIPSTPDICPQPSQSPNTFQTITDPPTSGSYVGSEKSHPVNNVPGRQREAEVKKKMAGKEIMRRSVKDLQRSAVSIARFHLVLEEECKNATKTIKREFDDIKKCVEEREQTLLAQLKALQTTAAEKLNERQENAAVLKLRCDRIGGMTDGQLGELRADIKHFIGDRKVDEEIAKTSRYTSDHRTFIEAISNYGEVPPLKAGYKSRSSISVSSSISTIDDRILSRAPSTVADDVFHEDTPASTCQATADNANKASHDQGKARATPLSPNELRERADVYTKLKEALHQQDMTQDNYKDRVDRNRVKNDRHDRYRPASNTKTNDSPGATKAHGHDSDSRTSFKVPSRPRNEEFARDQNESGSTSENKRHTNDRGKDHPGKPRNFRRRDRHRTHDGGERDKGRPQRDSGREGEKGKERGFTEKMERGLKEGVEKMKMEAKNQHTIPDGPMRNEKEQRPAIKESGKSLASDNWRERSKKVHGNVDVNGNTIEDQKYEHGYKGKKWEALPPRNRGSGSSRYRDYGARHSDRGYSTGTSSGEKKATEDQTTDHTPKENGYGVNENRVPVCLVNGNV